MNMTSFGKAVVGLVICVLLATLGSAIADPVVIKYDRYSGAPTIEGASKGTDDATSQNPTDSNYSATALFRQGVVQKTAALGADKAITFEISGVRGSAREMNATRPGIDLIIADESQADGRKRIAGGAFGGNFYNSKPFGELTFDQYYDYLHEGRAESNPVAKPGRGIEKANAELSARGGLQYAIPIAASTMQGSGFFPKPIGKPLCNVGDKECLAHGQGIGLDGMCEQDWVLRYLAPAQTILDLACNKVAGATQRLGFYPAVGGQSPRVPLQLGAIQGFEFVTPFDDLAFFPSGSNTNDFPSAVDLACNTDTSVPVRKGSQPECIQNTGQIGARYLHFPSWHQPFLTTWLLLDKESVWSKLSNEQRYIILRVAKKSLAESFAAANSQQCEKLQTMLRFNDGVVQRERETGNVQAVSGDITMAEWPQEALDELLVARNIYLDNLRGTGIPGERKTPNQKTADKILSDLEDYAASIGATKRQAVHGVFPVNVTELVYKNQKTVTCEELVRD